MTQLFTAQTSDGQSATIDWPGGFGSFVVGGTFNGTTTKLQMTPDGGTTWIDVGIDVQKAVAGIGNFSLPVCKLRADLADTTSPGPSINAWVI